MEDNDIGFREEVRAFLRNQLPQALAEAPRVFHMLDTADQQAWHRILYRKGWVVPDWPVEYGGTGWSARRCRIFEDELARAKAPPLSPFLNMIGPVLYTFGTEQQRAQHLPPLRLGDILWCQGYSEPEAGSDLASLRTAAVRCGDHYVVNGQKIWTSFAHKSDWMFCLVRTSTAGKPQAGISFLLIDMNTPGIEVRPIISIDGLHHFNEVIFSEVRVPVTNRIGDENHGWQYAKFLLEHERKRVGALGGLKAELAAVRNLAGNVAAPGDGQPLIESALFQKSIAEVEVDLIALECFDMRRLSRQERGETRAVDASIVKLRASEIQQRISELAIDTLGPYVQADQSDALKKRTAGELVGPPGAAHAVVRYLFGRSATILGGTSEIQRNIIFKELFDRR